MKPFAFDCETHLIRPGCVNPPMVCMTWQEGCKTIPGIAKPRQAKELFYNLLIDPSYLFIGANVAFDMGVSGTVWPEFLPLIFKAYEEDRVTDVQVREQLLDIAAGRFQGYASPEGKWIQPTYSLADVGRKYGVHLDKPQNVTDLATGKKVPDPKHCRLRFQELEHLPIDQWDETAIRLGMTGPPPVFYAMEDAVATMTAFDAQEKHKDPYLRLQFNEARTAWVLHLNSSWGLRTNAKLVAQLEQRTAEERDRIRDLLIEEGLVRPDGSRDTKAAAALMIQVMGDDYTKTKKGNVCLDEEACKSSDDPVLIDYALYTKLGTVLNKDCKMLQAGTTQPIHTRYGRAATGRTTSSSPNIQNLGRRPGPRECIVPRPGNVFLQADYEGLELHTLAQVCLRLFGKSRLSEILNSGRDPHLEVAAKILGISYEEAKANKKREDVDNARQVGKVANFGLPGGLGAEKLCKFAKSNYDVTLELWEARDLSRTWRITLPEMELYFDYINRLTAKNGGKFANVEVPIYGWLRGGASYCAAANTNFQALGAAAATRGLWYLTRACYVERQSVLFGSRPCCFVHDENLVESREDDTLHEKALEVERLMCLGANEYVPDVPLVAPPTAMRYWSKKAFQLKNAAGRIIPWNGEEAA